GDMHRTGKHGQITGPARRRCLTEAEMLDRGMTRNRSGQWTTGLVDTRWNAAHCSHVATQDGLKPLDPYSDTPNILKGPQKS
ncbi:hypothetical protein Q5762_38595, partial [Streptomyces sp. P9(2023)]|uniref:hypothetical protein n=1 Tax=Streptomyces sp. P9(2023) TaxID=3064394 RepID=UPI0028F404F9